MKMCHVTINVSDMQKSMKFYEEVVGIKLMGDLRPHGLPIVFMGEAEKDVKIELILKPEAAFNGSGIFVGFEVENVDAEYERVKSLGYPVSPMVMPAPNTKFFFVTDPDGVQIQLC